MAVNNYNLLVVFCVTFGSLTYGYNSAIIGAVIGLPSFFAYFNIDIKSDGGSRITGVSPSYITLHMIRFTNLRRSYQWLVRRRRPHWLLLDHLSS